MSVMYKYAFFGDVFVKAIGGCYPDVSVLVFQQVDDLVAANGIAIGDAVAEDGELVAVVFIKAIARAYPHKTAMVLHNTSHIDL